MIFTSFSAYMGKVVSEDIIWLNRASWGGTRVVQRNRNFNSELLFREIWRCYSVMTSLGGHLGETAFDWCGFYCQGESSSERNPQLKGMKFCRHFVYHLWEGVAWKHFRFLFLRLTGVPESRNRYKVSTTEADIRDIVQDNAGQHLFSGRTKTLVRCEHSVQHEKLCHLISEFHYACILPPSRLAKR